MNIQIHEDKQRVGSAAAAQAAAAIRKAIDGKGSARIIAATGASQFEFLEALLRETGIDWTKVEMFHLDEYVGISAEHPASFRKYLLERLIRPTGMVRHWLLEGEKEPAEVIAAVSSQIKAEPIDVAFVGIGENGHLAFNDPPADFDTEEAYIVVELDVPCRRQQVGEGWFASIEDVPKRAISMSIRQILAAKEIICIVPDRRKAEAVRMTLEGEIGPMAPASIMRTHPNTTIHLDRASASLLAKPPI